jgi:hypothetical protein
VVRVVEHRRRQEVGGLSDRGPTVPAPPLARRQPHVTVGVPIKTGTLSHCVTRCPPQTRQGSLCGTQSQGGVGAAGTRRELGVRAASHAVLHVRYSNRLEQLRGACTSVPPSPEAADTDTAGLGLVAIARLSSTAFGARAAVRAMHAPPTCNLPGLPASPLHSLGLPT